MSFTPKTPIELQIRKIIFERFNEVKQGNYRKTNKNKETTRVHVER